MKSPLDNCFDALKFSPFLCLGIVFTKYLLCPIVYYSFHYWDDNSSGLDALIVGQI
ncbi:MAG: hypothetical protein HWN65_22715 [Candidatus Helarchaeota archaeon]|nr:hypothetical protein [Candidatus Helarchaeota archaeon]